MSRIIRLIPLLLALAAPRPALAQASADPPEAATSLLEGVLPSVFTIAVETYDVPLAYGFSDDDAVRTAYRRNLDLEGYSSSGSGFMLIRDGVPYLVTNAHVIESAGDGALHAYSLDRTRYDVEVVGADTYRDVAVLRFREPPGPEVGTLEIREGDLRIAETVFAVGNPLGRLPYSVTRGIVSGLNRTLTGLTGREGYVQTDAVVAGGNSGGPLIGMDGRVVGLVTQGLTDAPINFALEAQHLRRFVDEIIRHGRVQRAHLGILLQERESVAGEEVFLASTLAGSPAEAALSQYLGWTVVSIGGEPIGSLADALPIAEGLESGGPVELVLTRDGESREAVSLRATTLSEATSESFARAALRQFLEIGVREEAGAIAVTAGPPPELADRMAVYEITSGIDAPMRPGERIAGAGYYGRVTTMWRTPSLHQLGVALRLVLRTGWIATLVEDAAGELRIVDLEIPATSML